MRANESARHILVVNAWFDISWLKSAIVTRVELLSLDKTCSTSPLSRRIAICNMNVIPIIRHAKAVAVIWMRSHIYRYLFSPHLDHL